MTDKLTPDGIREAGVQGIRWGGLQRILTELFGVAAMIALARLLAPSEFGEAVIGFAVLEFAGVVAYQSVSVPLIQRPEAPRSHLEVGMLIALLEGLVITAFFLTVGSLVLTDLLGRDTASLVELASVAFLLNGILAVPQALLERRLAFRRLASIAIVNAVLSPAISVALAATGMGPAALLIGPLFALAVTAGLMWAAAPAPLPRWQGAAARDLVTFGMPAMGSGLLHVGWQNIDYAMVAARLDAAALGFYWRAYSFGIQYRRKLTTVVVAVALPLYARADALATQLALRRRLVRLQTLIVFPLQALLILVAPVLIPAALGDVWEPAVVPTQILAVAGMAATVQVGTGPLILALGRPGVLLVWNLGSMIGLGVLTFVVAPEGLVPLAVAVTAFFVVRVAIGQEVMLRRVAGNTPGELWRSCLPALAATAGMLAAGASIVAAGAWLGLPELAGAALAGAVASGVYLAILRFAFAPVLTDLRLIIGQIMRRRQSEPGDREDEAAIETATPRG